MTLEEILEKQYPLLGIVGMDARNYLRKEGFVEGYRYDKWVKCSDRMPHGYGAFLCYNDGNFWTCTFDGNKWVQSITDYLPTHWMELPYKPK